MKKITLISAFMFMMFASHTKAQTVTVIDPAGAGGFELGETFEDNGWAVQNGTYGSRKWQVGTGQTGYTGERAAFIGSNATTVGTNAGGRVVHFYRAVTIPTNATNIQLAFKYKQEVVAINAETGPNDFLYLSLLDEVPATGNTAAASQFGDKYPSTAALPAFTSITVPVPVEDVATGTQKYLVFTFRSTNLNDPATIGWGGIDDIALTYDVPCNVATPTVAAQSFCNAGTVANLTQGLVWYAAAQGGTALTAATALTTGTYYAAAVEGDCESDRVAVAVTVTQVNGVEGAASQTFTTSNATLNDLDVTATGMVTWYASPADAQANTNPLAATTPLVHGTTYHATETIGQCVSEDILAVTVTVTLGAKEFAIAGFTYYPNPVNNVLNLTAREQITDVTVTNLLGQQVLNKTINVMQAAIDVTSLAKGTYLLTVTAGANTATVKIVK
jgi:hypothetical protein